MDGQIPVASVEVEDQCLHSDEAEPVQIWILHLRVCYQGVSVHCLWFKCLVTLYIMVHLLIMNDLLFNMQINDKL